MEGLFTVLTEAFADRMAPKLAKISLAAGIYLWLYSRIFSTKNCIGVSVSRLAKIFDKDRRSIQRALSRLVDEGLVSHEVYKHAGGGSVFHLTGVEGEAFLSPQNTGRRDKDVTPWCGRFVAPWCDWIDAAGATGKPHNGYERCKQWK